MTLYDEIKQYTETLAQQGLLRTRTLLNATNAPLIHFDSNDYLSLTCDARIAKAYQHGYANYPSGSGASMLLSGYHSNHQDVEQAFADFLGVDECVLFSSGYTANLAVAALMGRIKSHCLIDKSIHASLYDGFALSKANYTRFLHNDLEDLSCKLKSGIGNAVITEGIFSMSGQIAPLADISSLCLMSQATLLVDEAHSFGVLGVEGRGSVAAHGLTQNEVPLRIIPLGKAFAAQGAIVAGQKDWINALLQAGRSIIYSTAVSPALSYGLLKTLDIVAEVEERRIKLQHLINLTRSCISKSSLNWIDSSSPIQQLQLGSPHVALHYAKELRKKGLSCSAIRAPTVSPKKTGLRIILNYAHEPEHIHYLFKQIEVLHEHTS